jgi:hypothetical protein
LSTSFPICISFISSSSLIALARNFKTMLNRSGESGHPCLIPDYCYIKAIFGSRYDTAEVLAEYTCPSSGAFLCHVLV